MDQGGAGPLRADCMGNRSTDVPDHGHTATSSTGISEVIFSSMREVLQNGSGGRAS
jgi:hypothetical protein